MTPSMRRELTELPERMKSLPIDKRGYPIPAFVQWINGEPDFRVMNRQYWHDCVVKGLCWVCGGRLGLIQVFTIGPMCAINRTTSEPPSHRECAVWSARNCPFLSRPHMVRREDEFTEQCVQASGVSIKRNPGVMCLWFTRDYKLFADQNNHPLIQVGHPDHVEWFAEGRKATRAEIMESIRTGLPALEELARAEGPAAIRELRTMAADAIEKLLPKE